MFCLREPARVEPIRADTTVSQKHTEKLLSKQYRYHEANPVFQSMRGLLFGVLVIANTFENSRHAFLNAGGSGLGLFGGSEMQDVATLSARGEVFEGCIELGIFIKLGLKFSGDVQLGIRFQIHLLARLFVVDGLFEIGFDQRFLFVDLIHIREFQIPFCFRPYYEVRKYSE